VGGRMRSRASHTIIAACKSAGSDHLTTGSFVTQKRVRCHGFWHLETHTTAGGPRRKRKAYTISWAHVTAENRSRQSLAFNNRISKRTSALAPWGIRKQASFASRYDTHMQLHRQQDMPNNYVKNHKI
jgi:hypothetical protein